MARRRISEEDLIGFQARAEELSREVEVKYGEMDRQKQAEPEPVRDMGLLILADEDLETREFAKRVERAGLAVEKADILGYEPIDRFDRTPAWQRRLIQAQTAYTGLRKRATKVAVLGAGQSVALAALIAEQYPADWLICVGDGLSGGGRPGKRAPSRIKRIAKNNLFSIVCPVLTVLPGDAGPRAQASVNVMGARTRSRDVRLVEMGVPMANLFAEREEALAEAILEFLAEG